MDWEGKRLKGAATGTVTIEVQAGIYAGLRALRRCGCRDSLNEGKGGSRGSVSEKCEDVCGRTHLSDDGHYLLPL